MRALIPKGYFIDRFPTESATAADIQAREVDSARKVLQDQVGALEVQAQLLINKRMNFFAPHFGLKPQKNIADTYLLDDQGRWKGVTTGAAANSIANEIMLYKNPAPSSVKLTQIETVGLIMNMIKRYELTNQISSTNIQRTVDDVKEFYSLKRRPTYQEFRATSDEMKSFLDTEVGFSTPFPVAECTRFDKWAETYAPSNYQKHTEFPEGAFRYSRTASHPGGFTIIPINILTFYSKAYKSGNPAQFWQHLSGHRLGLYKPENNELATQIGVAIYPVDPFTGAPKRGVKDTDVVATGKPGSESSLLATVKGALFPELFTLDAGVNYNVGDAKVRYKNELAAALTKWNGVADKLNTPLVTIAGQSRDKRVTSLSVYLQPTGIEQAMERLIKGTDVFQGWFDSALGDKAFLFTDDDTYRGKRMITTQLSDDEWNGYRSKFERVYTALSRAMSHPSSYIGGVHDLANSYMLPNEKQDAADLLAAVNWPTGVPVKLFEVFVDDTRDANVVINTLYTYLEEESLMKPPEMYFPEPIQANVRWEQYIATGNSSVQSTEAGKSYKYEISKEPTYSMANYTHPKGNFNPTKVYEDRGTNRTADRLPIVRRYFTTGKTVVSKRTVSGPGSSFLKEGAKLIEVENKMTPMSIQMGSMQQEELNLLIGVGTVALIGGILLYKR